MKLDYCGFRYVLVQQFMCLTVHTALHVCVLTPPIVRSPCVPRTRLQRGRGEEASEAAPCRHHGDLTPALLTSRQLDLRRHRVQTGSRAMKSRTLVDSGDVSQEREGTDHRLVSDVQPVPQPQLFYRAIHLRSVPWCDPAGGARPSV